MVSAFWLNFFLGLILSYVMPLVIPYKLSILFAIPAIPCVIQALLVFFTLKETPMYLVQHGYQPMAF